MLNYTKPTAAETYHAERMKADRSLREITQALADAQGRALREGIDWRHVGDLVQMNQTLSNLADALLQRGEYAPENIAVLPRLRQPRKPSAHHGRALGVTRGNRKIGRA